MRHWVVLEAHAGREGGVLPVGGERAARVAEFLAAEGRKGRRGVGGGEERELGSQMRRRSGGGAGREKVVAG